MTSFVRGVGMGNSERDWRIGIVSDTHGMLRSSVVAALAGVDQILHAGDVGTVEVLEGLRAIAPVVAIRGNVDVAGMPGALPATEMCLLGGSSVTAYLVHSVHDLDVDPVAARVQLVVSGHSHAPSVREERGVTYLNPGSVGARRFRLPVSMAFVSVAGEAMTVELRTLEV